MFEAGFKIDPRQLLICETEVYGLISGPSWLRQSLVTYLTKLGYVRNPYEKCAMILPPPVGSDSVENEGIILIEVDDVLEGGKARHKKLMEQFYRQYTFGKRKRIMDEGDTGTLISGRRVRQLSDYSFLWDMDDYADKHMKIIEAPRGLLSSTDDLSDGMMSQVETCNGQIGWLGGNGRPDVAAGHSIIASKVKDRQPELVKLCNVCVKQA